MAEIVGQDIRGYKIEETLGQGGFGAVYRAYQTSVGREVAIKVILPQYANQTNFILRFEAEAQLVARLEHPHIIPLYDFWRDPSGAYLIMRYLRGGSLRGLLRKGALDPNRAFQIIEQIASALDTAHRHGVVHRDLKPDNMLIDDEGNAYLSDFGIAKIIKSQNDDSNDDEGTLSGSLGYVSPEQARGQAVSPQSDIYSFSVIVFEMLTGVHPFEEYSPTMQMVKHLTEPLPSITSLKSNLPVEVNNVIQQASAKNPEERFRTAGEFAQALYTALSHAGLTDKKPALVPSILENIINPYKGLRAFEESDADDFFGRELLAHKLLERLGPASKNRTQILGSESETNRFLAVVGPSGSGKSSVVKAGLIPLIRRGFLPGSANWMVVEMVPGANPIDELETQLLQIAVKPIGAVAEQIRISARSLGHIINEILPKDQTELVLIIDQFEEVFTQSVNEEDRASFLNNLAEAVSADDSRLYLVVTLRADFYDRPLMYANFGKLIQSRTEVILPLLPGELEQAITSPAERVSVNFERGLAAEIAADIVDQPGALPLLQYALTELFELRQGRMLTVAAYHSLGGVLGALARRAEDLYRTQGNSVQKAARILFPRLVTLGEGTEDTRRRALRSELSTLHPDVNKVIDLYGKARLLSFDRDPITRGPTVEVAHEALIRQWHSLKEWLNEDRESLRLQRHLTQSAQEWSKNHRDVGDLYRGARLSQAIEWAESHRLEMNTLEKEFINESRALAEKELSDREAQQRRELAAAKKLAEAEQIRANEQAQAARGLRIRGRFLSALLVIALIAVGVALRFNQIANTERQAAEENFISSEKLRLASQAATLLLSGSDIESAPLLAIQSLKLGYSPEADSTLQRAMTFTYPTHKLTQHTGSIFTVAFSPDSKYALTGSSDNTAMLWDAESGDLIRTFEGHTDTVTAVAYAPNNKWIATGSDDLTINIWDPETAEILTTLEGHEDTIWYIEFSPDSKTLASVSYDGTLRIWDPQSGEEILNIAMETTSSGLAWSPDGKLIASAGDDDIARLYDATTGEVIRTFSGHTSPVVMIAYSHNGKYIATGSDDKTARIWDVESGEELIRLEGHNDSIYGLAFSPDDKYLITGGYDRIAILWDTESGTLLRRFIGHEGSIYAAAFSPNGKWIITGSFDTNAYIWESGIEPNPRRFAHTTPVVALAVSNDNTMLITGSNAGNVRIWDALTGKLKAILSGHEFAVETVALSSDNKWILSGSDDETIILWDAKTAKLVRQFGDFTSSVWSLKFMPDNKTALVGSGNGLSLWDLASGTKKETLIEDALIYSASISSDGKYILAGGYDGMYFMDAVSGEMLYTTAGSETTSTFSTAISNDGKYGALGVGNELVIYSLPSMIVLHELTGHAGTIFNLAFSPDGKYIVSGSEDGSARIWDVASGETIRIITGEQTLINAVGFSNDSQRVYLGGASNVVWVWDVAYEKLIESACSQLNSDLSEEDREKFMLNDTEPTCEKFKSE